MANLDAEILNWVALAKGVYGDAVQPFVDKAEENYRKALELQKDGKWGSAQYAQEAVADLYRKAAVRATGGRADTLNALADEHDDAANYCHFMSTQGAQHSPAEIGKADGQNWGYLDETKNVVPNPVVASIEDDSSDDSTTDDTSEAEGD